MKNEYRVRLMDDLLRRKLEGKGAILLEGAKWCGKTTTAEQIAKSVKYMSQIGKLQQNIQLVQTNPKAILRGAKPRLIDEWQVAPELWDGIRFEVDHAGELGLFILTGSAVPADMSNVAHSGTGRFGWLRMRPMTLWESGESNGCVSLSDLFESKTDVGGENELSIEQIAFAACRGGWPLSVGMKNNVALDQAFDYVKAVIQRDMNVVDGVARNPSRVSKLLRSYARHQGSQATLGTICADLMANEADNVTEETIASYINALKAIFVVEDVEAWNPNLRSKTAIRSSNTRYFTDPSIATASLGLGPNDLLNDPETFGLVFETLCVRDLRVYAEAINGNIYHYRDKNGLECDAVVHLRNGNYGLVEIKLGGDNLINQGVATLQKLASKIDTTRMKVPAFLMVLVAVGDYAFRRPDGVWVVPISCLRE